MKQLVGRELINCGIACHFEGFNISAAELLRVARLELCRLVAHTRVDARA